MKKLLKSIFYSTLDIITFRRGVTRTINGFKIKFDAPWSRYYESDYEKDSFAFFKTNINQGDVILDIGAHIGLYSVILANLTGESGKVYCFEPTPSTFKVLNKTIELNKLKNVMPINCAISNTSEKIRLNLTTENGEGSNSNSIVNFGTFQNSIEIDAYSIDDFRFAHQLKIDVLKIDVEGIELNALKGARQTFLIDRPKGVLALHPENILQFGHTLEEIWEILLEYKMSVFFKSSPITKIDFCSQSLHFDVEFRPDQN